MERLVYISDLDGTLLNHEKQIPENAKQILNHLIKEEAVHFSVATARTPATVELILKDLQICDPVIVMNGVALYDLQKHQYEEVEYISSERVEHILQALGDWMKQGFIYTIHENQLLVHYDQLVGEGRTNFYEERKNLQYKKFTKMPLDQMNEVIYFVFIDLKENIQAIYNLLKEVEGIGMVMYKDLYSKEEYLLEVYSNRATKANGIKKLRKRGGYHKVVCFGDQLNDLSMFEQADEGIAVSNAVDEIKALASEVIGRNEEGSVAYYIQQRTKK